MTESVEPPEQPVRWARVVALPFLSWMGAALMTVLTAMLCLGVLWSSIWVGAGTLWDPSDNVTLESWTRGIGFSARSLAQLVTAAAIGLGVVGAITGVAAWRRSRIWISFGALCGAALMGTLVLGSAVGYSNLSSVIEQTHERLGPVRLGPAYPLTGDSAVAGDPEPLPSPQLSAAEAEAGVRSLLELTAGHATGSMTAYGPVPGDEQPLSPETAKLVRESCTPDPNGQIGVQFSLRFTLPSDEGGNIMRDLVAAWAAEGYPATDRMRDVYAMGSDTLPVGRASLNDSSTIDGKIWATIESRCATVDP